MAKTKQQLLAQAKELKLDVNEDNTVAQIQAEIDKAQADKGDQSTGDAAQLESAQAQEELDKQDKKTDKSSKPTGNSAQDIRDRHYDTPGASEEQEIQGAQYEGKADK